MMRSVRAVRAQDALRKTFSVVIGLRSLVDQVRYDDHVDFYEMNETVKAHDDVSKVETVDGNNPWNGVFHCSQEV
jgi:hypothetical protein